MDDRILFSPIFVQVALTLVLLFMLGSGRTAAVRRGEVRISDIALGEAAWPPHLIQIANCFRNQLELPILFYVAIVLAVALRIGDSVLAGLAWGFVATRVVHAYVHVTTNHVPSRFRAYVAGVVALVGMWLWLAVRILVGGEIT